MMEKKKIDELMEKNASLEEAKKFLNDGELLEEFRNLKKMKAVLSDMKIAPPEGLAGKVLQKSQKPKRSKFKRFAFAFTSVIAVIFVSLLFVKGGFIFSPTLSPTTKTAAPPKTNLKTFAPPRENKAVQPIYTISVIPKESVTTEDVQKIAKKYCISFENNICTISTEKLPELLSALKKAGKISPETDKIEQSFKGKGIIKIRIEVMKK